MVVRMLIGPIGPILTRALFTLDVQDFGLGISTTQLPREVNKMQGNYTPRS